MLKKCKTCNEYKDKELFRKGNICISCEKKRNIISGMDRYNRLKNKIKGNFVYRLIYNNEIVYVGKSTQLCVRLNKHSQDKNFDKIEIVQFDNEIDMSIAEIYFINKYKPRLNREFKHRYCDSMPLYELDMRAWFELKDYNADKPEVKIGKIFESSLDINFGEIKTCFIRSRSKNFLVYVQNEKGKQKKIGTFQRREDAQNLVYEIKDSINK